jgi:kynurenine formamidase
MCLPGTVEKVREQTRTDEGHRVDRRAVLLGGLGAAVAATFPASAAARRPRPHPVHPHGKPHPVHPHGKRRLQDLTHVFTEGFPVFTGDAPQREDLATFPTAGFYSQRWTFGEHSGTHMDAPGHFVPGGRLAPQITPEELLVPIVVVDISAKAAINPDATVTGDDLRHFEHRHGRIPDGALVCMHSGWAAKLGNPLAYKGGASYPNYHFPGFSAEAAMWLAEERGVSGIGVDTLSLDPGNSTTFPVHVNFLGADRYGVENLANLDKIPPRGAFAYVGLIPWEAGSGGPCRVVASW